MRKEMCKQKIVLETIKNTRGKGGMTPAQIQLAEAQTEDYQTLRREVVDIKADVTDSKNTINYIKGQVDILVQNRKEHKFFELCIELIKTKGFWALLILGTVLYLCGKFGINPSEVKGIITGG